MEAFANHANVGERLLVAQQRNLLVDLRGHLLAKLPFLIERDAAAQAARSAAGTDESEHRNREKKTLHFQHRT